MKSVIIKMIPGVSDILMSVSGLCQPVTEGVSLPDGGGFTFHKWIDESLAEYFISCEDSIWGDVINEMIAKGLTITFPPEPEVGEGEVFIA